MAYLASTIINLAKTQVGYKEGSGNITKYAKDFDTKWPNFYNGRKQGAEWCDIFVDWCFCQSWGPDAAMKLLCQPAKSCGAGCSFSYGYYKNKGQAGKTPKVGAQIFFYRGSSIGHTGIVVKYDSNKVYTIEGNSSNAVRECSYSLNDKSIAGYGYPKYDAEPAPAATKSLDDIAKEVINGKWGNGSDRQKRLTVAGYDYTAVQKRVNELLKQSASSPTVDIDKLAREVIAGKFGNGEARKKALGSNYSAVQKRVNELLKK